MTVHGRGSDPGFPDKYSIPFIKLDDKMIRKARKAREKAKAERPPPKEEPKPVEEPEPAKPDLGASTQPLQKHDLPTEYLAPPTQPLQKHDYPTQPLQPHDYPTQILPKTLPKTGQGMPWHTLFPEGSGQAPRTAAARTANARRRAEPIQVGPSDVPARTQAPRTDRGPLVLFPHGQGGEAPSHQPQEPKELVPEPVQGLDKGGGKVKEAVKTIGKETVKGAAQGAVLGAMVPVAGETGVSEAGGAAAGAAKGVAVGIAKAAGRGAAKGAAKGALSLFPEGQTPNEAHKTQTETPGSDEPHEPRKYR